MCGQRTSGGGGGIYSAYQLTLDWSCIDLIKVIVTTQKCHILFGICINISTEMLGIMCQNCNLIFLVCINPHFCRLGNRHKSKLPKAMYLVYETPCIFRVHLSCYLFKGFKPRFSNLIYVYESQLKTEAF